MTVALGHRTGCSCEPCRRERRRIDDLEAAERREYAALPDPDPIAVGGWTCFVCCRPTPQSGRCVDCQAKADGRKVYP